MKPEQRAALGALALMGSATLVTLVVGILLLV